MSTTWLRPMQERDKAIRDHLETTFFYDEETGELWEPTVMPPFAAAWPTDTDDDSDLMDDE